ncbi:MAG: hypothetical protein WAM14_08275 [Candidatus Nitrosopolaris sp.]
MWGADDYQIQQLKNMIIWNWNQEGKKQAIDTLASYRKKALPALTEIASAMWWDNEIKIYTLDKIRQINESNI